MPRCRLAGPHNKNQGTSLKRTYGVSDTGTWIEGTGVVRRLLPDDNDGARHQRVVLDLRNGQTVLLAHNLDLAERIPLGLGDRVQFRGVYEWNELGGLLHWTHHDPLGIEEGGFVLYRRKRYR
jgi:Protein of unknown function (DUF3465)